LDMKISVLPHPPYHHPVLMTDAAESVRHWTKVHLASARDTDGAVIVSGMDGNLQEVGPSADAIKNRMADEIDHVVDWNLVHSMFAGENGNPPLHVLAYGLTDATGEKDVTKAQSGGKDASGKWYFHSA
jgi:hypothetical protein